MAGQRSPQRARLIAPGCCDCWDCGPAPWSYAYPDDGDEDGDEEMKDIDQYAEFTEKMWFSGALPEGAENCIIPVGPGRDLAIMCFGLAGETGEVMEHIKKLVRDCHLDRAALKKELGDAAFYWARICKFFGMLPSDVLATNVEKLESRHARGKMRGDGDDR
jgi:NTP pyrophosphatase (non-canonical NTP hydrolase)